MSCANNIQDMSAALQLLQDPQSRQLLGDRASQILIERQLRDMAATVVMIEQGQERFENNQALLEAMYGATKTAVELCAVVPLAGPCRVADMGLTAAEIGGRFARGDGEEAFIQSASAGAGHFVGRGVGKSLSSEWWGNIYGYFTDKAISNAPDILDCGTVGCRNSEEVQ